MRKTLLQACLLGIIALITIDPVAAQTSTLWLRADSDVYSDTGTTPAVDGDNVRYWVGQTTAANIANATAVANRPDFVENALNFNPAVNFGNGTPEALLFDIGGSVDLPNGGAYTIFAVGESESNSGFRTLFEQIPQGEHPLLTQNGFLGIWNGSSAVISSVSLNTEPHLLRQHSLSTSSQSFTTNGGAQTGSIGESLDVNLYYMGNNDTQGGQAWGNVSEVLLYNSALNATQIQQVESYLAVKYGMTLHQSPAQSYLNSSGAEIYDADGIFDAYDQNIVGLGEDSGFSLDQKVTKSINNGSILTLATILDFTSPNRSGSRTSLGDGNFLITGHDGAGTSFASAFDGLANSRMDQVWAVDETGSVGPIYVAIPNTTSFPSGTPSVVISSDATFDSSDTVVALTDDGTNYWALIDPADAEFFTFAGADLPNDYGDAPDSYSTLAASGGPSHGIDNNILLGATIDIDTDGFSDGTDDNGDASDDDTQSNALSTFYATSTPVSTGVGGTATGAEGAPDGTTANVGNNDELILQMGSTLTSGSSFNVYLRGNASGNGAGTIEVCTTGAAGGATCTLARTLTNGETSTAIQTYAVTAPISGDFVRIIRTTGNMRPDAVEGFNTAVDDEDGATFTNFDASPGASYSLPFTAVNASGSTVNVAGWIDFDLSGTFDTDEFVGTTVANGGTGGNLIWTLPGDVTAGTSYARLRISSDAITSSDIGGALSDGEVEDYQATITAYPFDCSGLLYQIRQAGSNTILQQFNLATSSFVDIATYSGQQINGGWGVWSEGDGLAYGVDLNSGNPLYKIDGLGNVTSLGTVPGLPTNNLYTAGDVLPDGRLVFIGQNSNALRQVDISGASPTYVGTLSLSTTVDVIDLAYNPADGRLYGVDRLVGQLFWIDLTTGVVSYFGPTVYSSNYGAAWFSATGLVFYAFDSVTGDILQIFVGTDGSGNGNPNIVATVPSSASNDGLGCRGDSPLPVGSISGTVFSDSDLDGVLSGGDTLNGDISIELWAENGTPGNTADDVLIRSIETLVDGTYQFTLLSVDDTYRIELVESDPDAPAIVLLATSNPIEGVVVTDGVDSGNNDFMYTFSDYSDAPIGYGDAIHSIVSGIYMGAGDPDADSTSLAGSNADGDDLDGTDDEDGVTLPVFELGQSAATVTVTVAGAGGYLQAWIDWNADGDFSDAGEQITTDVHDGGTGDADAIVDGTIELNVAVPETATLGTTFARFRWSTTSGLDATTAAVDGEVEDYAAMIIAPTEVALGEVSLEYIALNDFSIATLRAILSGFEEIAEIGELTEGQLRQRVASFLDHDGDGLVGEFRWETLSQRGTLGFYVERQQSNGTWQRLQTELQPAMIPAPYGAEYRNWDPSAVKGEILIYRLIEQETNGQLKTYGPFLLR